ncbi:MAG: thioredoxin domain-containing protein [Flavobacteriales bacterium]|nr:thioredoxin domain-containing protein [Flavobacteriales bacterium]
MSFRYLIIILSISLFVSCVQNKEATLSETQSQQTNHLINENSPYLLQHAHNPVNWYPWGVKALNKAKKENKPIIISIGYSACHWCHIMEQESFEKQEVAQFMNTNFIAIKVDREERPDIDKIYLEAVQLISGNGGWPLNCIALPDGRPVYGGTYFTTDQWLKVLQETLDFINQHPDKAENQAQSLLKKIQPTITITSKTKNSVYSTEDLNTVFDNWKNDLDFIHGGYRGGAKFPMPIGYQYLLNYHYLTKNQDALKATETTLNKLANGGIYDQIGGGFSRYATDQLWRIPHFEKMLYDNAQLVSLYTQAYQHTQNENYKITAEETLRFIKRKLTSPEGNFYSSINADSESEEGKYYTWTQQEIIQLLGNDAPLLIDYYNIKPKVNWTNNKNILYQSIDTKKMQQKYNIDLPNLRQKIKVLNAKLLKERQKRVPPSIDNKTITTWNALMLIAYIDAYTVFDKKEYLDTALKNAHFINTKLSTSNNRLYRNYKNNKASINGFLDDYAFTIKAFIAVYQATFDEQWLLKAKQLADYTIQHFYDTSTGLFFYTSDIDNKLITRTIEITDDVIPSSNSEMAKNLYLLGSYFYNEQYISKSKTMLNNVKGKALKGGVYYANWDILMSWFAKPPHLIVIIGDDFEKKQNEFNPIYLPNTLFAGGKIEGKIPILEGKLVEGQTTIYVCQDKTCKRPVTTTNEALKQIKQD